MAKKKNKKKNKVKENKMDLFMDLFEDELEAEKKNSKLSEDNYNHLMFLWIVSCSIVGIVSASIIFPHMFEFIINL